MFTNFKTAAVALAIVGATNAQTWSDCNPVKGDKCEPNPAFGGEDSLIFPELSKIEDIEGFFTVDGGIKYDQKFKQLSFSPETGMKMSIGEERHAPTLYSKDYLFFGHVEVELRAAPGAGIITSIVLQSDSLDEIDWEFVGNDQAHVQTNFFSKGVEDYSYGQEHALAFNPMDTFHTYALDWTPEAIVFSIDGTVVREAFPDTGVFPQTPCQLRIGTWVGGKGDQQGTIDWAGGRAQWDKAPFDAYYRRVQIIDYAGGYEGAKQYEYSNTNGTWQSIRVVGGKQVGFPNSDFPPVNNHETVDDEDDVETTTLTSGTATATSTATANATSTEDASAVSSALAEVSSLVSSALESASSSIEYESSAISESIAASSSIPAFTSSIAESAVAAPSTAPAAPSASEAPEESAASASKQGSLLFAAAAIVASALLM